MLNPLRHEGGGIYVEALVAVAILATALLPIFGAFLITPAVQRQAGLQIAALNLARGELERLHGLPADRWDGLSETIRTVEHDGITFTLRREVAPADAGLVAVTLVVTWSSGRGGEQQVTLGTSIARRPEAHAVAE